MTAPTVATWAPADNDPITITVSQYRQMLAAESVAEAALLFFQRGELKNAAIAVMLERFVEMKSHGFCTTNCGTFGKLVHGLCADCKGDK